MITGRECCEWTEEVRKFESFGFFPPGGGAEGFVWQLQAEAVPQYIVPTQSPRQIKAPLRSGSHHPKAQQRQMLKTVELMLCG